MTLRIITFATLFYLLSYSLVYSSSPEGSMKGIIDLDSSNVDSYLNGNLNAFVEL